MDEGNNTSDLLGTLSIFAFILLVMSMFIYPLIYLYRRFYTMQSNSIVTITCHNFQTGKSGTIPHLQKGIAEVVVKGLEKQGFTCDINPYCEGDIEVTLD